MKPVTLPLFKSLYYVLFATVVVIVLGGCEKDDENEIRFYTVMVLKSVSWEKGDS